MVWDTRRDLAVSMAWKQVGLGFPNLTRMVHMASSWRLRRVEVENGQVDAMGCSEPF
jgi:hypothetical protein